MTITHLYKFYRGLFSAIHVFVHLSILSDLTGMRGLTLHTAMHVLRLSDGCLSWADNSSLVMLNARMVSRNTLKSNLACTVSHLESMYCSSKLQPSNYIIMKNNLYFSAVCLYYNDDPVMCQVNCTNWAPSNCLSLQQILPDLPPKPRQVYI